MLISTLSFIGLGVGILLFSNSTGFSAKNTEPMTLDNHTAVLILQSQHQPVKVIKSGSLSRLYHDLSHEDFVKMDISEAEYIINDWDSVDPTLSIAEIENLGYSCVTYADPAKLRESGGTSAWYCTRPSQKTRNLDYISIVLDAQGKLLKHAIGTFEGNK